jgi:hypothetical protein
LCLDLLALSTAEAVAEAARRVLASGAYAGCNVFCIDTGQAYVVYWGETLDVKPLAPGLHVLTSGDVDDAGDPRVRRAFGVLAGEAPMSLPVWMQRSAALCRLHAGDGPAICLHGDEGGTVSSTIVALPDAVERARYLHANGPPCRTDYRDYSAVLAREVLSSGVEKPARQ